MPALPIIGAVGSVVGIGSALGMFGDNGAGDAAQQSGAASEAAARASDASTAMSADLFNYHKANYRPLEQSIISDAAKAGSPAEMETRAGQAGATVAQQFGNARRDFSRNMGQYGVNPNSGKFADIARTSAIDEAAATVGAENNARTDERKFGLAAKMDAAGLGRGIAGTAMSGQAQAAAAAGTASAAATNSFNMNRQQNQDIGTGIATIGAAGKKLYDNYEIGQVKADPMYQTQPYQQNIPGSDSIDTTGYDFAKGGLIRPPSKTHGYLKGGRVSGPGTGTSDSIPTTIDGDTDGSLSNGEYVLNAKAVEKVGLAKLDEMNLAGLPEGSQMKDGVHLAEGGRVGGYSGYFKGRKAGNFSASRRVAYFPALRLAA